ncbi:MAG: chalcone isomerase family protein [Oleiphilaceae bacterium]|nr:chalcone isomerase family protein [Oleiphilaceae bacterium]
MALLGVFLLAATSALLLGNTVKVNDVDVPETLDLGEQKLVLNGAGTRTYFFIKAYVGALYLPRAEDLPEGDPLRENRRDGRAIIESDQPRAISLFITSDRITRERMVEFIRDGFDQALGGDAGPLQDSVDELLAAFHRKIREGDRVELIFTPEQGVEIRHNGDTVGQVKGEARFKQALFAIWLGKNPVQESLRDAMLGQH